MKAIDILRRVTNPQTDAQAVEAIAKRLGSSARENVSSDDLVTLRRASDLREKRVALSKHQRQREDT